MIAIISMGIFYEMKNNHTQIFHLFQALRDSNENIHLIKEIKKAIFMFSTVLYYFLILPHHKILF